MLKRKETNHLEKRILAHALTIEALGADEITQEQKANSQNGNRKNTNEFDVMSKQNLLKDWDNLSSDEILEGLKNLAPPETSSNAKYDINWRSEILLLKALAQEKSLLKNKQGLTETYFECRGGNFYSALILNNLAVLKAREENCDEAIKYLHQAILVCFERNSFFGCAILQFCSDN